MSDLGLQVPEEGMTGPYQSMPPAGGAENGRSCLASYG